MAANNGLLSGVEIIPEQLRGKDGSAVIMASPKLQKLIAEAHATLEGNVRLFLEEHCGVYGARNLETPMDDIKLRMKLMNVDVRHVNVHSEPQLSGTWVIQGGKPMVSFPDRKMRGGKLQPQMMIKLRSTAIEIISGPKGNA